MDADPQDARVAAVAALVELLDTGTDPSVAMINECVRQVKAPDPALARLLPRAALPRRLDASVVAMLAEAEAPGEGERLLGALQKYSFVRPHPSGGWAYHDRVRDAVREYWAAGPRAEEFRALSRRLSRHMLASFDEARRLARELQIATGTLLAAKPARFASIRTASEWHLAISFKEAFYHAKDAGPQDASDLFAGRIGQVEGDPRLVEIAMYEVRAARSDFEGTAGPVPLGWLRYWEARLLRQMGQRDEAEANLHKLIAEADETSGDPGARKLRHWALGDLGLCLELQERLTEAEAVYAEDIRLMQANSVDPWNVAASHRRLGSLELTLRHVERAVESFQAATAAARESGNNRSVVLALVDEAGARRQLGQRGRAMELAAEALHESRTLPARRLEQGRSLTDDLRMHRSVALAYVWLVAPDDLRLVDTLLAEVVALAAGGDSEEVQATALVTLAEVLRESGALRRAGEVLDSVRPRVDRLSEAARRRVRTEAEFQAAFLSRARGERLTSLAQWTDLLTKLEDRPNPSRWNTAAARSNRAEDLIVLGRLDEAQAEFEATRQGWHELGLCRFVAQVDSAIAEVRLRQGAATEAEKLLGSAREELLAEPTVLADDHHRVAAALSAARGDFGAAAALLRRRGAEALCRGEVPTAAGALGEAAAHAARIGDWPAAAASAEEAAGLLRVLEQRDASRPSDTDREADSRLAAGAQLFFDGGGDRSHDLDRARRCYRDALERDPANAWMRISRYYVCFEQGDRGEAARELAELAAMAPPWLAPGWLERRRAEVGEDGGGADADRSDRR